MFIYGNRKKAWKRQFSLYEWFQIFERTLRFLCEKNWYSFSWYLNFLSKNTQAGVMSQTHEVPKGSKLEIKGIQDTQEILKVLGMKPVIIWISLLEDFERAKITGLRHVSRAEPRTECESSKPAIRTLHDSVWFAPGFCHTTKAPFPTFRYSFIFSSPWLKIDSTRFLTSCKSYSILKWTCLKKFDFPNVSKNPVFNLQYNCETFIKWTWTKVRNLNCYASLTLCKTVATLNSKADLIC